MIKIKEREELKCVRFWESDDDHRGWWALSRRLYIANRKERGSRTQGALELSVENKEKKLLPVYITIQNSFKKIIQKISNVI